jgi:hypothetical protein
MTYNRKPKRNKLDKPKDVFVTKNGVKYKVLNIGGTIIEVRASILDGNGF